MADANVKNNLTPANGQQDSLAPLYISGMPVNELVESLQNNKYYLFSQMSQNENQFWESSRQTYVTADYDMLDITFDTPHTINKIAFEVSRFPQEMRLFYLPTNGSNTDNQGWMPIKTSGGTPIAETFTESVPSVITPTPIGFVGNWLHRGAEHWAKRVYEIPPISIYSMRILFRRIHGTNPPRDIHGNLVRYSHAIKNLQMGYTVTQKSDVPITDRSLTTVSEREAFSSSVDMLGSPVSLSMRENRAIDLLAAGGVWKSEPQPVPNAIVNFYVDARDFNGNGQVVEKFKVDTQTSGVSCNLYYSNDTLPVAQEKEASDRPLSFPQSQGMGFYTVDNYGVNFTAQLGLITVSNNAVQFDQTQDFSIGVAAVVHFDTQSDSVNRPLFSIRGVEVLIGHDGLTVQFANTQIVNPDVSLHKGDYLSVVVTYSSDGTISLRDSVSEKTISTMAISIDSSRTEFEIGGSVGEGLGSNSSIYGLYVQQKATTDDATIDLFFNDVAGYIRGEVSNSNGNKTSNDMILRMHTSFMSSSTTTEASSAGQQDTTLLNQFGIVGGPPNAYEDLVWSPLSQSYKLHSGYLEFPPIKAKFFKMEFTNLVAQPYDDYFVQSRTVKFFPEAATAATAVVGRNASQSPTTSIRPSTPLGNPLDTSPTAAQQATVINHFEDQAGLYTNNSELNPPSNYAPTTAVVSSSTDVAANLRSNTVVFNNLQQQHPSPVVPQFTQTQRHIYQETDIAHTQKVAFFAGLTSLKMYRVDYTQPNDTGIYIEKFIDGQHIQGTSAITGSALLGTIGGWTIDTQKGGATSTLLDGTNSSQTLQSVGFSSTRRVTAIQFATQQSQPIQLLKDHNVEDATLSNWSSFGDAQITMDSSISSQVSGMIHVSRNSGVVYWNIIMETYTSYDDMMSQNLTWDDLMASDLQMSPIGGLQAKDSYQVSTVGQVYAAARVYLMKPLTAPLLLQIINGNGQVVTESEISPHIGQTAEWWTSMSLKDYATPPSATWDALGLEGTWDQVSGTSDGGYTWDQVMQLEGANTGTLSVRLAQETPTLDEWYVDSMALFEDAIFWEFSRDGGNNWFGAPEVRNNPDACLTFPPISDNSDGLSLMWRATTQRPNQHIDSLVIRPRYDTLPMGQAAPDTMVSGATVSKRDVYPEIHEDPHWTPGFTPIPQDWWIAFRRWLQAQGVKIKVSGDTSSNTPAVPTLVSSSVVATTRQPDYESFAGYRTALPPIEVADTFRPVGKPQVAILPSGSIAIATAMSQNTAVGTQATESSFIRLWKIDPSSKNTVITFDYQPKNALSGFGVEPQFTLQSIGGDQVLIVMDDTFDETLEYSIGGISQNTFSQVFFQDANGYDVPDSLIGVESGRYDWFGSAPYLSSPNGQWANAWSSGGELSAQDPGSKIGAQLPPYTHQSNVQISSITIKAYFQPSSLDMTGCSWIISSANASDDLNYAGIGVLGDNVQIEFLKETGWYSLIVTLDSSVSQWAIIQRALAAGTLRFALDPGGAHSELSRRVGYIGVDIVLDVVKGM